MPDHALGTAGVLEVSTGVPLLGVPTAIASPGAETPRSTAATRYS